MTVATENPAGRYSVRPADAAVHGQQRRIVGRHGAAVGKCAVLGAACNRVPLAINGWSAFLPIIPNGGSVRPYVLVTGTLFAVALIVFLKPGPKASQGSLQA
jgi:hypothetical protein